MHIIHIHMAMLYYGYTHYGSALLWLHVLRLCVLRLHLLWLYYYYYYYYYGA